MRIGLVLPSIPAYSETFFINKIKGLEQHGYEVVLFVNSNKNKNLTFKKVIVAPQVSGNKVLAIIGIIKSAFKLAMNLNSSLKFFKLEKKDGKITSKILKNAINSSHILSQKLDWLHFGFGTMAIDRENVAIAINAKMAVSFRGFDIGIYPIKNENCYNLLWKKVDKIHVISDDIEKQVIANGFIHFKKITKITPAIDINLFQNIILNDNKIINITTIARLHWKKGLEYTLHALAVLNEKKIDFHYTIIGDGDEKERLIFTAYQLGILDKITFAGKLNQNQIVEHLNKTSLYLQYSIQEGFCNAVLEAQAMGKICIVSDAEGLSENVLNNKTGFVVQKRNPEALAIKIAEVIQLSEIEKKQISNTAVLRLKNEFSVENQIAKFIKFYEKNI
jgi:glycosyltransferase involved in cell wall biosynthesis